MKISNFQITNSKQAIIIGILLAIAFLLLVWSAIFAYLKIKKGAPIFNNISQSTILISTFLVLGVGVGIAIYTAIKSLKS